MKPKVPPCPNCGSKVPNMLSLTSRVFALWHCDKCGQEWTSDPFTGRLISRKSSAKDLEGGI